MDKRQFIFYHKIISSRLNAFLDQWDFLNVVPQGIVNEYSDLIGPILEELQVNNEKESLIRFVNYIVESRYGCKPSRTESFVKSILLWWVQQNTEVDQRDMASKHKVPFSPIAPLSIIGLSDNTDGLMIPINGLRHPSKENSNGWFIWSGEELKEDKDFFKPTHVVHLNERCPQVLKYLCLPPGYRFLIDNKGYEDVWFDEKLLQILE